MESSSPTLRIACFVRTCSLVAPVDSTLRTLERLEADGVIDDFTVGAWPAEVRLDDPAPHSEVVDMFEQFEAWAAQWDVSICPPFAVETRVSEITDETREVLITPIQCLAVYVNDVLLEVFPHSTDPTGDGDTYTVREALDLLEELDIRAFGREQALDMPPSRCIPTDSRALDSDMCPRCETPFVTGQGVYACPDCDWAGTGMGADRYRPLAPDAIHTQSRSTIPDEDTPRSK